jgi:tRNA A37 threonylcarbamoyladenosine dehydratase
VCDYDVVEDHNIAQQFFKLADCGKPKVEALKENVEVFTGATVNAFNCAFTPEITE